MNPPTLSMHQPPHIPGPPAIATGLIPEPPDDDGYPLVPLESEALPEGHSSSLPYLLMLKTCSSPVGRCWVRWADGLPPA